MKIIRFMKNVLQPGLLKQLVTTSLPQNFAIASLPHLGRKGCKPVFTTTNRAPEDKAKQHV